MTPAIMVLLGLPGNVAVGTSLGAVFASASFAVLKRRGSNTIDVKLAVTTACGSIGGILVGLGIMESLKKARPLVILGKEQAVVQYVLLCSYVALLTLIAAVMIFDLYHNSRSPAKRVGLFSKIKIPPYLRFNSLEEPKLSLLPVVCLGVVIGILTALMGVGGGIIMLPALIYFIGQRTVKAAGTSLLLVWISSAISATGHISAGNIDWPLLGCMLIGGIIGTNFGTITGLKLSGHRIRSYFVYVVVLAVLMVGFKLFEVTFF